ncbi:MAG: ketol-acid reductoisomerase [Fusobacterium varium]|uniref:ketol-acid reductoisomerase n=1 Tax=Fusobacterium varium TaxID=856 RepID=UPI0024322EC4|nr:ketol-acid reductoisomerase [Fusobacterium varium]
MGKIYYDNDGNIDVVKDMVVAIIGYGNQGRSQALNMRDSGIKEIIVGSIKDNSWEAANKDGFKTYSISEASSKADILFILLPDEVAPKIYNEEIAPNLKEGTTLNFSSGYNITYGYIKPATNLNVIMVAPRMIGKGVRETYQTGIGFPTFVVVNQDATGNAKDIAIGLAKALGSTKAGAIEVTFNDETYLDLMSEQGVWPLIMTVIDQAFKLYMEKGHSPEAALTELYLSKEPMIMMEKMADMGLFKQLPLHSRTSQYGQISRFKQTDPTYIRAFLEEQYNKIVAGEFAKEWETEMNNDLKHFEELKKEAFESPISIAETEVKKNLSGQK